MKSLQARSSISNYWPGIVLCALMGLICFAGAIALLNRQQPSVISALFCAFIGALCVWGAVSFGKLTRTPPLVLEADESGIWAHYGEKKQAYFDQTRNLIHWSAIEKISYSREIAMLLGDNVRSDLIQIHLHDGHGLPAEKWSVLRGVGFQNGKINWKNSVFLEGRTDFGKPESLAAELESRRQKHH